MWPIFGGLFKSLETIIVSGTFGSPHLRTTLGATNGTTTSWTWIFNGDLQINGGSYDQGVEWADSYPSPIGSYWIRAQVSSGDSPGSGPTLGVWHQLTGGTNTRTWNYTWNGSNVDGVLRVDIAKDSGGSNIVATGYKRTVITS